MTNLRNYHLRMSPLLLWLALPILLLWVSTGYILGIIKTPVIRNQNEGSVLATGDLALPTPEPITWDGGGLVTFWFDDAWQTQYSAAFPLMKEKKIHGVIAVPTRAIDTTGYMTWQQIKRIATEGWEITAHSRTHQCDPQRLTDDIIEQEVLGSKQDLAAMGIFTDHYVTPCGTEELRIDIYVTKHYLSRRTSEVGFNPLPEPNWYSLKVQHIKPQTTPKEVESWLAEAKRTQSWVIFMFHQIDNSGNEYSTTESLFAQFIESTLLSQVPIVIPSQVYNISR